MVSRLSSALFGARLRPGVCSLSEDCAAGCERRALGGQRGRRDPCQLRLGRDVFHQTTHGAHHIHISL